MAQHQNRYKNTQVKSGLSIDSLVVAAAFVGGALALTFNDHANTAEPARSEQAVEVKNQKHPQNHQRFIINDKLLNKLAFAESSGRTNAYNSKSGVLGLFQMKKDRWLELLYRHGKEEGYDNLANPITREETRNKDGQIVRYDYVVENKKDLNFILSKRKDEEVARAMTKRGLEENIKELEAIMGDKPIPATAGVVYMTHHFGVGGAARALKAMDKNPKTPFEKVAYPGVCKNNRNICYHNGDPGKPRSVTQVHNLLVKKLINAPDELTLK